MYTSIFLDLPPFTGIWLTFAHKPRTVTFVSALALVHNKTLCYVATFSVFGRHFLDVCLALFFVPAAVCGLLFLLFRLEVLANLCVLEGLHPSRTF